MYYTFNYLRVTAIRTQNFRDLVQRKHFFLNLRLNKKNARAFFNPSRCISETVTSVQR